MRMLDEIVLRKVTRTQSASGYPVETVAETAVYADVMSVKRSEFYSAGATGVRADIAFVINADEYDGQTEVEYGGSVYNVVRTYQMAESRTPARSYGGEINRIELTCARR